MKDHPEHNGDTPPKPRSHHKETWGDVLKRRWWKPERVLSIGVSVFVAAFALGVALRTETHSLPKVYNYITNDLKGALSTRSVGVFPGNMQAIQALLDEAIADPEPDTLHIMCDMVAYGIMSDPEAYDRYRRTLTTLAGDKRNVIILQPFDTTQRSIQFDAQFAGYVQKPDSLFRENKYKIFFHYWERKQIFRDVWPAAQDKTLPEFKHRIMEINRVELEGFRRNNIQVDEVHTRSNVFMWWHNRDNAVFSLFNNAIPYSPNEVSIQTRDALLISQLLAQLPKYDPSGGPK